MGQKQNDAQKDAYLAGKEYGQEAKRNYMGAGWLTIAFYIFVVWIGGVIANIIFFTMAQRTFRVIGKKPAGYNFLLVLLILNIIPIGIAVYLVASYLILGL
jgi:hypothetical protein